MKVYHVVAVSKNNVIGKNNGLPWPKFSSDLKAFKALTLGHPVIMGRKTFESIFKVLGKPLPGRTSIVLTRKGKVEVPAEVLEQTKEPVIAAGSIEEALKFAGEKDAFIIGGAEVYASTMNDIDGVYLTRINDVYEGDAYYPPLPEHFQEHSRQRLQDTPVIETILYVNEKRHQAQD